MKSIPLVDILYFVGTMILVVGMAIVIVRATMAKPDKTENHEDNA